MMAKGALVKALQSLHHGRGGRGWGGRGGGERRRRHLQCAVLLQRGGLAVPLRHQHLPHHLRARRPHCELLPFCTSWARNLCRPRGMEAAIPDWRRLTSPKPSTDATAERGGGRVRARASRLLTLKYGFLIIRQACRVSGVGPGKRLSRMFWLAGRNSTVRCAHFGGGWGLRGAGQTRHLAHSPLMRRGQRPIPSGGAANGEKLWRRKQEAQCRPCGSGEALPRELDLHAQRRLPWDAPH